MLAFLILLSDRISLALGFTLACMGYGLLNWNNGMEEEQDGVDTGLHNNVSLSRAVISLGYLGYRRRGDDDYMVAGRRVSCVLALLRSNLHQHVRHHRFRGLRHCFGMGTIWLTVLNIGLGIFIAFVIFENPQNRE